MDIGKSVTYIFEDPNWLSKVLIGTVILLVSIPLTVVLVGFLGVAIVGGYGLDVLKNVRQRSPQPLPEWRDRWGEWLVLGLKLLIALFIWSLPTVLLSVPLSIGSALIDSQDAEFIGVALTLFFSCLSLLWTLVVILVSPAIYIRLAETERLGSTLEFGKILDFTREHIGDVLIAAIVYMLLSLAVTVVASVVGALLCLVGLIFTIPAGSFINTLIQSHLYGQVGMGTLDVQEVTPAGA